LTRARTSLSLDALRVVETISALQKRIAERFPGAGLGAVCGELLAVAEASSARAARIARRHILLRLGLILLAAAAIGLLAWVLGRLDYSRRDDNLFGVFQGIEAVANLAVLTGGTLLFAVTIEQRLKRRRAWVLGELVHVDDVQDDAQIVQGGERRRQHAVKPQADAHPLRAVALSRLLR